MRKRNNMPGRLTKRGERGNLPKSFVTENPETDRVYRVVQVFPASGRLSLIDVFDNYDEAVAKVDTAKGQGLYYYVYGNSNRILYSSEEG